MIRLNRILRSCITLTSLLCLTLTAPGADKAAAATASAGWKKPGWLSDLSLSVKESYDDNIFGVSGAGVMDKESSWVTTLSPKVGINFVPLLGKQSTWQTLSLVYAPDIVVFHGDSEENHNDHRVSTLAKAKFGAVTMTLDNAFLWIDGSSTAPIYRAPDNQRSAYSTGLPRERREQIKDQAKATFQYDREKFFVRATASLLFYDLRTDLKNLSGYQNYADRYDVNGGVDLGYKATPQLAFTLGYRYGHQYQDQYSFSKYSSPSDYQRVLFGVEGKPWKWLTVSLSGGPDFRRYPGDTAKHITPLDDKNLVTYFVDATLVAEVTPKDSLSFKSRHLQWVASTGQVPYLDSCYDLAYRRKLTSKWVLDLGAKLSSADYTVGNLPACQRLDWQYLLTSGLTYTFNSHWSANLSYALDLGRNNLDKLVPGQTEKYREFNHQLISLGGTFKF